MPRINLVLAIAASLFPVASFAQEAAVLCPDPDPEGTACAVAAPSLGRIAFVNPETGEVLTGEAAAAAALEEERSAFVEAVNDQVRQSFTAQGLEEQRTETGAVAVDLEGRFQSPLVATIDPKTGVSVHHFTSPPAQD